MFAETLKFTLRTLLRKPVRSLLTILQVALGIAAVALVLNVMMQPAGVQTGPSFIGADEQLIQVYNGREEVEEGVTSILMTPIFTLDDLEAIRNIDGVVSIPIKEFDRRDMIELNGMRYLISGLRSVNEDFMKTANPVVVEGSLFLSADYETQSRTVVISQQAAHALFGDESAVGKKLVFASSMLVPRQSSGALAMQFGALRQEFEVIGVIDISSADAMPSNLRPEHFMIPFARRTSGDEDSGLRAGRAVFVSSSLSEFTMVVKKNAVDSVKQAIEDTLASKYGSRLSLVFAEPYIPSASSGNTEFGLFLGGFALVGMIVSSIGILSIMMVSVVERTREIGMRREIGASRGEVVTEILMEAGLLAAAGACVGLILAMLGASPLAELAVGGNAVNSSDGIARLGLQPAVVSLLVSVAIGLLAGLYPALQAARRAPVDALRELTS